MPWACKRLRPTTMSRGSPRNGSESNPPSLELTLSGCAHRLDRATQSVTGHWRGEVIEANENRSTSIQDAHECPARTPFLCTSQRMRHTDTQLVSSPPPVWFHLPACVCARLSARVRLRSFASVFMPSRLPVRAAQSCSLGIECSGSRVPESFLLGLRHGGS